MKPHGGNVAGSYFAEFSDAYVHETTALWAEAGIGQLDRHEHPRMLGPPRPRERRGR